MRTSKARIHGQSIHFNRFQLAFALFFILLSSLFSAQTTTTTTGASSEKLKTTLCSLYKDLNSVIPTVAFVLFVLAGVSYAGGQFFGAETRAKSISWSMSMVTGAVVGLLIVQVASVLISNLSGYTLSDVCPV